MFKKYLRLHHLLALAGCLAAAICDACAPRTPPIPIPGVVTIEFGVVQGINGPNGLFFVPAQNVRIHGVSLTPPLTVKEPDQVTDAKGQASFDVEQPTAQENNAATYQFTLSRDGQSLLPLKYTIDQGSPILSTDGTIKVPVTNTSTTIKVGVMILPRATTGVLNVPVILPLGNGKPLPPPNRKTQ
jgi:hypothetical protein